MRSATRTPTQHQRLREAACEEDAAAREEEQLLLRDNLLVRVTFVAILKMVGAPLQVQNAEGSGLQYCGHQHRGPGQRAREELQGSKFGRPVNICVLFLS